jgi:hypothetical protein
MDIKSVTKTNVHIILLTIIWLKINSWFYIDILIEISIFGTLKIKRRFYLFSTIKI